MVLPAWRRSDAFTDSVMSGHCLASSIRVTSIITVVLEVMSLGACLSVRAPFRHLELKTADNSCFQFPGAKMVCFRVCAKCLNEVICLNFLIGDNSLNE